MRRSLVLGAAALLFSVAGAIADPIEGNWKTASGDTAAIASCGGSFCVTLKTGKHAGKQIGKMAANGANSYKGSITDPADDKTYSGSGSLSGNTLSMKGCVLAVLCKSQTWSRL